nr:cation-translocating P-type ATPase [Dyella soli]
MTYAFVIYIGVVDFVDFSTRDFFRWMGFLLSVPVVLYSAHPFLKGTWREWRARRLGLNTPIAASVWLIFLASGWNTWRGTGEVYFDSITMFVFLVLAGRFLELRAMQQGRARTDALQARTPLLARRKTAIGDWEWVPAETLVVDDVAWLERDVIVPADGRVTSGAIVVDVSALTGESQAMTCGTGDRLLAGSQVVSGDATLQVERPGTESFAARLADLSRRTVAHTPEDSDPRLSRFVTAVLVLAALTAVVWMFIDPAHAWPTSVAVLVVACPCSYALTRPSLTMQAQLAMARQGVLMTDSRVLDRLPRMSRACFDKTGTLTSPRLVSVEASTIDPMHARELAGALAIASHHPLAQAVLQGLEGERRFHAIQTMEMPGHGVAGTIEGQRYWLGRPDAFGHAATDASALCLGNDERVICRFAFDESLRDDAARAITRLQRDGVHCEIVSGDLPSRVEPIAASLQIEDWLARQSPDDKREHVADIQGEGHVVLLVGDGSNDAPALAQADISASLASGTELAQSTADLLLVSGRLEGLVDARELARAFARKLDQGQRWSLAYNLAFIPLATLGLVTPWLAALGMSLSSLVIIWRSRGLGAGTPLP